MVLPAFPPRARPAVIAGWAAVGAVGAAAGPPLGGLLLQASWRWVFLVNLPLGLVSIWYAARRVEESRDPAARGVPDLAGTVALMVGVGALDPRAGQGTRVGLGEHQYRRGVRGGRRARSHHGYPVAAPPGAVLEMSILRVPSFALAVASALAFFTAFGALLLSGVLFLTGVWGHSVLRAGLELAPGPVAAMLFAIVASRIGPRVGMGLVGAVGGLLVAIGLTYNAARLGLTPDYLGAYLPGQLIGGAGIGLAMPAFTAVAVSAVPPSRFATAIGISSMFRQVGGALGVAAFVAIVGTPGPGRRDRGVPARLVFHDRRLRDREPVHARGPVRSAPGLGAATGAGARPGSGLVP